MGVAQEQSKEKHTPRPPTQLDGVLATWSEDMLRKVIALMGQSRRPSC